MKDRSELTTAVAPDLPPCPRCSKPAHVTSDRGRLLATWSRVHCAVCTIGRGAETLEEARAAWTKMCERWGK